MVERLPEQASPIAMAIFALTSCVGLVTRTLASPLRGYREHCSRHSGRLAKCLIAFTAYKPNEDLI